MPIYKLHYSNSDSTAYKCPVCYESTLLVGDGLLYCPACGRRFILIRGNFADPVLVGE